MQAETRTLTHLFQPDVRYLVPLYQRPYVWTRDDQWEPLWEDIAVVANHVLAEGASSVSPTHFLGAIVIQQQENAPGSPQQFMVIDGQQRLTTLQLLLHAAARAADGLGANDAAKLLTRFVYNDALLAKGDDRFKVWPTNANRQAFVGAMAEDASAVDDDPSNEIQEAHGYFEEVIREWATEGDAGPADVSARLNVLRVTLSDLLKLVAIRLDDGDSPQVIFETLNARGTPLIALDLLKNAVFLQAAEEGADTDKLYSDNWAPELDREFWRSDRRAGRLFTKNGDLFLQYWLVAELAEPVPVTELFETFRDKVTRRADALAMTALIPAICRDARTVREFDAATHGSPERRFFELLDLLDTGTFLPVALVLLRSPEVDAARRGRAFAVIEDFLVRRLICGATTKNYNRLAASLVATLKADLPRADDALEAHLAAETGDANRWPRNDEVRHVILEREMYGRRRQDRLVAVLWRLEEQLRADEPKSEQGLGRPSNLTLEHLLPQAWEAHWPLNEDTEESRSARDARLHRLGNLTLTTGSLNSSLSNGPWHAPEQPTDKRRGLLEHSLLRLNALVVSQHPAEFDDGSIDARGEMLADLALRVWPGPDIGSDAPRAFAPTVPERSTGTAPKRASTVRRGATPRSALYLEFWGALLDRVAAERPAWGQRKRAPTNWLSFRCERFHPAYYGLSFARGDRLRHELYIDLGSRATSENLFNRLKAQRGEIERLYGGALEWEPLPATFVCRVADYRDGDVADRSEHGAYVDWFIRSGDALRRALDDDGALTSEPATVTTEILMRAAAMRDQRATWNEVRSATGTRLQSSQWFRRWEAAGIPHRPARGSDS